MKDLTVDVGVLMSGSGLGAPQFESPSRRLMERMKDIPAVCLTVDDRGKILLQYGQKMVSGTLGHQWVRQMATQGKVIRVSWRQVDRGTVKRLKECHVDWEDYKYVRTAEASENGKLVSHDPGYSPKIQKVLRKRLSVHVVPASVAGSWLLDP